MAINIGLAFDQLHPPADPYLVPIVQGVGEAAGEKQYHWQMFPLAGECIFSAAQDSLFVQLLESRQIHGVLTCSPFPPEDISRLGELGIPTITICNEYPAAHTPWVIEDVAQGTSDLVRHVVDELGHQKLALVMGPEGGVSSGRVRSSGLLYDELSRHLRQRGIYVPATRLLRNSLHDLAGVTTTVHNWLTGGNRPTAILCATDALAMEVLNVAAVLGLDVPTDLSVAAWYDEVDHSSLTSVRVPLRRMGHEAVLLASRALTGETVSPVVLPVQLVTRRTTGKATN